MCRIINLDEFLQNKGFEGTISNGAVRTLSSITIRARLLDQKVTFEAEYNSSFMNLAIRSEMAAEVISFNQNMYDYIMQTLTRGLTNQLYEDIVSQLK